MKKVYLETPEAVINALKDGKTVETDMKYYVLKDGLLNCYAKNKIGSWWSINSAIYDTDKGELFEGKIAPHCANVFTRQEAIERMSKEFSVSNMARDCV